MILKPTGGISDFKGSNAQDEVVCKFDRNIFEASSCGSSPLFEDNGIVSRRFDIIRVEDDLAEIDPGHINRFIKSGIPEVVGFVKDLRGDVELNWVVVLSPDIQAGHKDDDVVAGERGWEGVE